MWELCLTSIHLVFGPIVNSEILMKRRIFLVLALSCGLAGDSLRAADGRATESPKPHVVIVMAEGEYKTDQTLPPFAKANLQDDFRVTLLFANKQDRNDIPGLDAVKTADVLMLSIRRRTLPEQQLDLIRTYIEQGKPLVAVRTSCHAFCLRNEHPPAGLSEWPNFDQEILGCHYHDHHGNDIATFVHTVDGAHDHPIMKSVPSGEWRVYGSLYRVLPLADTTTLLMMGRAEDELPHEPVAWTNRPQSGNRVFFTTLGHPQDFALPGFVRLLRNGIYWTANLPIPTRDAIPLKNPPQK